MEEIKQDLTTHLESIFSALCTKLHIPIDNPSSSSPPHTEGDHSSHSHNFQNHHFQRDLRLPLVDVNKFDGPNPTSWVTQMEHYFSLYNITDDLSKLHYDVLHLDQEIGNGGNGEKLLVNGILLGHTLWQSFMNALTLTPTIWVV
jgi:hypothetical protein